jgi:hypothetical protein
MTSAFVSHEDVYTDDSDDQVEQEECRCQELVRGIDEDTILGIVTDGMRHDDVSELRAYIRQELSSGVMTDYMPDSTALRLGREVAHRVNRATSGEVAMRLATAR